MPAEDALKQPAAQDRDRPSPQFIHPVSIPPSPMHAAGGTDRSVQPEGLRREAEPFDVKREAPELFAPHVRLKFCSATL